MNMKKSPTTYDARQHDIEICNMLINVIDAICYTDKHLADSYILNDCKAELQYFVDSETAKIKLDNKDT